MTFVATAISAGVGIAGKAIGAGIGNKKGKEAAAEQNLLEQQNYEMQYANTVKQREQLDQQHSGNVMQSYNPQGQTQMFWGQMGGNMPVFQGGGNLLNYQGGGGMGPFDTKSYPGRVRGSRKGTRKNKDGTESTVLMSSADNKAFATLFQDDQGGWFELPWREAMVEAEKRGELYEFTSESEAAAFAEGSWKDEPIVMPGENWTPSDRSKGRKPGGPRVKHMEEGGVLNRIQKGETDPLPSWMQEALSQGQSQKELREETMAKENWYMTREDDPYEYMRNKNSGKFHTRKKGNTTWKPVNSGTKAYDAITEAYSQETDAKMAEANQGFYDEHPRATGEVEFDALTQLSLGSLGAGMLGKGAPALFASPTRSAGQKAANVAVDLVNPLHTKSPAKIAKKSTGELIPNYRKTSPEMTIDDATANTNMLENSYKNTKRVQPKDMEPGEFAIYLKKLPPDGQIKAWAKRIGKTPDDIKKMLKAGQSNENLEKITTKVAKGEKLTATEELVYFKHMDDNWNSLSHAYGEESVPQNVWPNPTIGKTLTEAHGRKNLAEGVVKELKENPEVLENYIKNGIEGNRINPEYGEQLVDLINEYKLMKGKGSTASDYKQIISEIQDRLLDMPEESMRVLNEQFTDFNNPGFGIPAAKFLTEQPTRMNKDGGYMGYPYQDQPRTTINPTIMYKGGGRTLLEMVQAGNPQAYWPKTYATNANNPGNVYTHRDNMDQRYSGSSQNFQSGGNLLQMVQAGNPNAYWPSNNMNNLNNPGNTGRHRDNMDQRYYGSSQNQYTKMHAQGGVEGQVYQEDPQDQARGLYQRLPKPRQPMISQRRSNGNIDYQRMSNGNNESLARAYPLSIDNNRRTFDYNGPSGYGEQDSGRIVQSLIQSGTPYAGNPDVQFQGGGNMYETLQNIGYDNFSAFQGGGAMPAGQPMPAEGGQLQPISDNSVVVQGDNPGQTDGVDVGNAMVDNGEMIKDLPNEPGQRVFSDTLKPPGSKETFAQLAKKLEKQKHPNKPEQNERIEMKLDELFQIQQLMNGDSHGENPAQAAAGGMDPAEAQNAGKPVAQMGARGHFGGSPSTEQEPLDSYGSQWMQDQESKRYSQANMDSRISDIQSEAIIDSYGLEENLINEVANNAALDNRIAERKSQENTAAKKDSSSIVTDYDKNWDYKMEGDKVYTKRKYATKWTNVSKTAAGKAIYKDVFSDTEGPTQFEMDKTKAESIKYDPSGSYEPSAGRYEMNMMLQDKRAAQDKMKGKKYATQETLASHGYTPDEFFNLPAKERRKLEKKFFGRKLKPGDMKRVSTPGSVTQSDIEGAGASLDEFYNMSGKDRKRFEKENFGRKLRVRDLNAIARDSKYQGGMLNYQGGGYTDMNQAAQMQMEVPYPGGRKEEPPFVKPNGYLGMVVDPAAPQQNNIFPEEQTNAGPYNQKVAAQNGMLGSIGSAFGEAFKKPTGGGMSSGVNALFDGAAEGVSGGLNTFGNSYTAAYGRDTNNPYMGAMGTIGNVGQFGESAGDLTKGLINQGQAGAQYGGEFDLGYEQGGYANGGYGGGFDYRHMGPQNMSFNLPMSMLAIGRRFPTPGNADLDYLQRQAGGSWGNFDVKTNSRRESNEMGRNKRKHNDDTPNVNTRKRVKKLAIPSTKAMHASRGNARGKGYQMGGWLMPSVPLNKRSLTLSLLR